MWSTDHYWDLKLSVYFLDILRAVIFGPIKEDKGLASPSTVLLIQELYQISQKQDHHL